MLLLLYILTIYTIYFLSYIHIARVLLRYCVIGVHADASVIIYIRNTQKLLALGLGMYLVFVSFLCSHVP